MKNKKLLKSFSSILLVILIITGAVLFSVFQISGRKNLQRVLDESISFTQLRVSRYKSYSDNDQIKSLVRLQDKAEALSWAMAGEETFDEKKLQEYAESQRLSGILVLDEELKTVMQFSEAADTASLFGDMLESSYVQDIIYYPQKSYMTRLAINGGFYDFEAVA